MKTIGSDTGLNLIEDTKPPKSLYTEVNFIFILTLSIKIKMNKVN